MTSMPQEESRWQRSNGRRRAKPNNLRPSLLKHIAPMVTDEERLPRRLGEAAGCEVVDELGEP